MSAGTAAVLFAFGVLALAWHRVAGQVALGITVLVYAVLAAVLVSVAAAACYVLLWVRHRARNPELLAGRHAASPAPAVQAVMAAAEPRALEPPRVYLNVTPDELAAIMRHQIPGMAGDITERN